jgi:outer membrane protein OmpA-like peptidoglycan-associated protein
MVLKSRVAFIVLVLLLAVPLCAEADGGVAQPFFIKVTGQYYFHPISPEFVASDFLSAWPGFRAALGYEWRRFDFSLESGLTRFEGKDPYRIYVEDLTLFPLVFKFSYTFSLPKGFGIQPEAGVGAVFYNTIHDSVIHSGPRNMQESFTVNMMASARLNLVWEIPRAPFLRLHIGGGVDMIPEIDALIFIPVIEMGITFKPRLPRRIARDPEVFEDIRTALKDDEDIFVDEVLQGIMMTIMNIHYVPESDQILPSEYPRLDMIAAALKLVPSNRRFLVDGHVADVPSPSPVSNRELSAWRARRMIEALVQRGIAPERFLYRAWGGTKPLGDNATEAGRRLNRRVEITILKEGIEGIYQ